MSTASVGAASKGQARESANGSGPAEPGEPTGEGYRVELLLLADIMDYRRVVTRSFDWLKRRQGQEWASAAQLSFTRTGSGEPSRLALHGDRGEYWETVTVEVDIMCRGEAGVEAIIQRNLSSSCMPEWRDPRANWPPSLVADLIQKFGAFRDRDVLLTARRCDRQGVPRLIDYLRDPGRTMPVLVASPVCEGRPILNVDRLATKVAGLAHVYALTDDYTTATFCHEVGRPLACSSGAMRLYWPRPLSDVHVDGKHPEHPKWLAHEIVRDKEGFVLELLGLARASASASVTHSAAADSARTLKRIPRLAGAVMLITGLALFGATPATSQDLIRLPSRPSCVECTISLEPVLRLDPGGDLQWEAIIDQLPDGRFIGAPTWSPGRIAIFGADGSFLETLGSVGEGPGEYREITGVFVSPRGHVFVVDGLTGRITELDQAFRPVSTLASVRTPAQVRFLSHDTLIVHVEQPDALELWAEGEIIRRFGASDPNDTYAAFRRTAISSQDTHRIFWTARRERYQVDGYGSDGSLLISITGDFDWFVPIPERRPEQQNGLSTILDLTVDAEGRLWLLTTRRKGRVEGGTGAGRTQEPTVADIVRDYEYRIDIIDVALRDRVVSAVIEGVALRGFIPGDPRLYSLVDEGLGLATMRIWNPRLTRPGDGHR